jgi:integrase/recombinase XerD
MAERSPYHGTTRQSWDEVALAWSEAALPSKTDKTRRRYLQSLEQLRLHLTGKHWDEVDKRAVQAFVTFRKSQGVTTATIRRDLTVLSGIAKHAQDEEWSTVNPVELIGRRNLKSKTPPFVRPPAADVEAIMAQCYGAFVNLARFYRATGLRMDEGRLLAWPQTDLQRRQLRLDVTKNRTVRTVSLSDEALALLRAQPRSITTDAVFFSQNGGAYLRATEMWSEAVRRAQKQAQDSGRALVRCTLHGLRHLYAIEYLERGGNLYLLQLQLGHGSIRQTEWYLQFLTPEAQLASKLGAGTN